MDPLTIINRCFEPGSAANDIILTTESVHEADWVTTSTEPLKTILKGLNENIAVLPNLIDKKEWKYKRKPHKKVRIGWVYSQTHTPDIEEVREALEEIVEKYKDKVEIVIIGTDHDIFKFPTENMPRSKIYRLSQSAYRSQSGYLHLPVAG